MIMTFSIDQTFTQYTKWANEKKKKNPKIHLKRKLIDNTWCLKNEISQITTMVLHVLFEIRIPVC